MCGTPSLTDIQGIKDPFGTLGGTVTYKLDDDNEFKVKLNEILSNENLQLNFPKKLNYYQKNYQVIALNNWLEIENKLNE